MKGRYKPQQVQTSSFESSLSTLPTDRPVAVYYRQSTTAQVGNVSTYIQTIDIPSMLQVRGWKSEDVILIDADEGISGQTKIDEREGMKQLFNLITTGAIGTVACQDEDRLFRDVTQIQVNIFIEACKAHHVMVLTPSMTYDFAHPQMGTYHARQFRFKSEMAADYITTVIKGKLHAAKLRLMHEGKWAGGNAPFGFIVDQRKTVGGVPNSNYRKLTEFTPYSQVLNQWFHLFNELNGNLRRTQLEIERRKLYVDLSQPIPEGFYYKKHRRLLPSSATLAYIFYNVAYIGHWAVQERVVIYNNHPGIVPLPVFMRAYNHLCAHDFDGNENKQHTPFRENARPTKECDRQSEKPLLSGLLFTPYENDWATIGTSWDAAWKKYRYYFHPYHGVRTYVWSKTAVDVDLAVYQMVEGKLHQTFAIENWEQSLHSARAKFQDDSKLIEHQLANLETVTAGHAKRISILTSQELIRDIEREYAEAKAEKARLLKRLEESVGEEQQVEGLLQLRESFREATTDWNQQSREAKQRLLHSLIDWIAAHWEGRQLRLVIHWRDGKSDEVLIRKIQGKGPVWLPEEDQQLASLVHSDVGQVAIMQMFPSRTWCSIMERMRHVTPEEKRSQYKRVIAKLMTYDQYQRQELVDSKSKSQQVCDQPSVNG